VEWASANDIKTSKCELAHLGAKFGRGVIANEDIKTGDVPISVPESLVFLPERSRISEALGETGLCHGAHPGMETCGLVIAIMLEFIVGASSPGSSLHTPYFDNLKHSANHPVLWEKRELALLNGTRTLTHLFPEIISESKSGADETLHVGDPLLPEIPIPGHLERWFFHVVQPFFRTVLNSTMLEEADISTEQLFGLYRWAAIVVSSNSYELGDDRYQGMVPMWDMVNHASSSNLTNVKLAYNTESARFEMVATRPVGKGEQLFVSYGDLPNAELLRRYAFIDGSARALSSSEIPFEYVVKAAAGAASSSSSSSSFSASIEELAERLSFIRRCKLIPSVSGSQHHQQQLQEEQNQEKLRAAAGDQEAPTPPLHTKMQPRGGARGRGDFSEYFEVKSDGGAEWEMLECLRLLMLPKDSYDSFVAELNDRIKASPISAGVGAGGSSSFPRVEIPPNFKATLENLASMKLRDFPVEDETIATSYYPDISTEEVQRDARKRAAARIVGEEKDCLRAHIAWLERLQLDVVAKACGELWDCITPRLCIMLPKNQTKNNSNSA